MTYLPLGLISAGNYTFATINGKGFDPSFLKLAFNRSKLIQRNLSTEIVLPKPHQQSWVISSAS
jgi:hypothetical protein